jgi:hypothetical protein
VFSITAQRVLVLLYLSRYQFNIFERFIGSFAATAVAWIVVQAAVLVLQNLCGTLFFVPSLFKPKQFEYKPAPEALGTTCAVCLFEIDTVAESVLAPCGHYFHRACLKRWLAEAYCCPICRHSAPPMDS